MEDKDRAIIESIEAQVQSKTDLTEGRVFDFAVIIALAKKFSKSFKKTKAYKLGIIDAKGNILRPPKTRKERDAFTPLDNIVTRIKKLIPKNLWYLLSAAYLFKGFFNNRTYTSLYEDCNTIEEMTEAEEKRLALERAKVELDEISESTKFTKEEFWIYIASQHTDWNLTF